MKIFSALLATVCVFSGVVLCEDSNPFNQNAPDTQQEIKAQESAQTGPLEFSTKHGYKISPKIMLQGANFFGAGVGVVAAFKAGDILYVPLFLGGATLNLLSAFTDTKESKMNTALRGYNFLWGVGNVVMLGMAIGNMVVTPSEIATAVPWALYYGLKAAVNLENARSRSWDVEKQQH